MVMGNGSTVFSLGANGCENWRQRLCGETFRLVFGYKQFGGQHGIGFWIRPSEDEVKSGAEARQLKA